MFNLIEEEHKKNSNEIAKELKRRSYMEQNTYDEEFLKESDYPLPEREPYHFSKPSLGDILKRNEVKYDPKFTKNQKSKNSAGYRHSYAEPKLRVEKSKKYQPEILHRTNSSVSNTGRVGIASVHPY